MIFDLTHEETGLFYELRDVSLKVLTIEPFDESHFGELLLLCECLFVEL